MQVIDRAAMVRQYAEEPYAFMLTALLHDFGKADTTEFFKGRYHSYNHENELDRAMNFLNRIGASNEVKRYCKNMIPLHMKPHLLSHDKSSVKATNKMFDQAVSPNDLLLVAVSDGCPKESLEFLLERLKIFEETMSRPYVTGDDLIAEGFKPGEEFGKMLEFAHKLRLAGVDREAALKQIRAMERKKK